MKWDHLVEGRDMCAFVGTEMNRCVSNSTKTYLITEKILASQDGLYSTVGCKLYIFCQRFFFPQCHHMSFSGLRGPPSWAWQECNRLLRVGRP